VLLVALALKTLLSISQNGISPFTLNKQLGNHLNKDIITASSDMLRIKKAWEIVFIIIFFISSKETWIKGCIFSGVRPFYERAVSKLDPERSMHRPVQVTHSSFTGGSHTIKNTASDQLHAVMNILCYNFMSWIPHRRTLFSQKGMIFFLTSKSHFTNLFPLCRAKIS
jgi:hypothetical protein